MRQRRNRWFTIVATDMFSGAFAAIVLLDSISPKEIGLEATNQELSVSYETSDDGQCPADGDAIAISYKDGAEHKNTLRQGFNIRREGANCVIYGGVSLYENEVSDVCVVISELKGGDPKQFNVELTGATLAGGEIVKSCP